MVAPAVDFNRLTCAVNAAREILKLPRQIRVETVREAAGSRWGNAPADQKTQINLLGLFQNVVTPLLVAQQPRYHVDTSDHEARPGIRIERDWLNEQSVQIGIRETARTIVTDALTCTGIGKVSLASPCDAAMMAWGITAGEPVFQAVDLDDWVYDVGAKDFRYASFMGHRYRCPKKVAAELFKRANFDGDTTDPSYNREGDERIEHLFRGDYQVDEFEEHVELWEIYLPREGLIVTLAGQDVNDAKADGTAKPLWVQKWVGPPTGPYLFLKFGIVPGAALGKGPMIDLYEPHVNANNVHRKANNTIRRLKEVTIYSRNQEHDAKAIKEAADGHFVPVDNPDKIKTLVTAGAALQGLFLAAGVYKDLFNHISNVDVIGGRGPQTGTVGQEKIVNANAGVGIAAMHGEVATFMSAVGENLLWYAHHHPELTMESEYKLPGTRGVNRKLYPASSEKYPRRDWPFNRAKLRIDPYSLRRKEPEERLAFVQGVLGMLTPLLPILAGQGVALDAHALVETLAYLGDAPELNDLFTAAPAPTGGESEGGSHERTLPGQTERTYTRNSNPQPDRPDQKVAEMSPADFGATQGAAA